ncbi:type II toxin-antitoxin system prevent-host-death family antitoxin [Streptomyces roseirectus]|uniref:Type II toxin-antitoxin system prevent-host-death family antitoxin n=1 Tax=Streptomyces roseirectus TaxID=2768066 RepID=A0A7H0IDU8_9ACTN|nr:type II toxin-antitoxin system prevent-host-death family antitoxin [Streptomyces roseirectus]QNP70964.1 type II toxin-antitoxin system prevent-host-death family antitoxin [Streptomyces roseirectus]
MSILRENPTVLSVTEAAGKGVAGLVKAAEAGEDVMVERHHKPVAAVIGIERLRQLEELEEDLVDALLVLTRAATDTGERSSLDEVLRRFGVDREGLEKEFGGH